ncbi:hypothetical protein R7Q39_23775 [Vibrio sp. 947]|uniref:hypothetical protein n=1 Tax=unclassified Vibrio TaxID=2614977 RepID=UPI002964DDE2|nr:MULTISPECIES: hypothetical protein [unclassified Vibrio]MDW1584106.1 hypothetical protein [Vibrio sp. Vb2897]MDW1642377.1 hypothetical protein [Vibrio sp. Vb2896]MDW1928403.1 hypothetical protein [Vibrio sp. 947]
MEKFKVRKETKFVFAVQVGVETFFLRAQAIQDPYSGMSSHGNFIPVRIEDYKFELVKEDKCTLFNNATELVKMVIEDRLLKSRFDSLLAKNELSIEDVALQEICGENVSIHPNALRHLV